MRKPRPARIMAVIVGMVALACAPSVAHAQAPSLTPELEQLRSSLDKYKDPYVAVRDGYFSTLGCVDYPKPGGEKGGLSHDHSNR